MILEVIGTSVLDAKLAQEYGAGRIELISGIMEGGVTPSYGLIEKVVQSVQIPVNVMVRPHANSFAYDDDDLAVMVRDIRVIRELGASGIVLGTLTPDGQIDESALQLLLSEAGGLSVTYHRAFDELQDLQAGLQQLTRYPSINRVLTSGGKPNVLDARDEIAQLTNRSQGSGITILAGSGITVEALDDFIRDTGVKEVHMGSGVRMNGRGLEAIDPDKLKAAAAIVSRYSHE